MTVYYVDLENGVDASGGTSFAARKKTVENATNTATAGDTVRVMASIDPGSLGVNGTFTNKSITVTLATAVSKLVTSCDSAWTAATNVTATTSATRKEGTNSASLAIASAFTTGIAAYFATGTLDLSAYRQLSFWIQPNAAIASGVLRIDLCSDTVGAVPVYSFTLNRALNSGKWAAITVDQGATMSSATAIASISVFCISDPGTVTLLVDNFDVCKGPAAADCLNINCLIGKNDGFWFPIKSINGVTIVIDQDPASTQGSGRGYAGTTATVAAYARQCIVSTALTGATWMTQGTNAGTSGNPITISGGWDRTAMSSQSGETWCTGIDGAASCQNISFRTYYTWDKLSFVRFIQTQAGNTGVQVFSNGSYVGFGASIFDGNSSNTVTWTNINQICNAATRTLSLGPISGCYSLSNTGIGFVAPQGAYTHQFKSCTAKNNSSSGFTINISNVIHSNLISSDNASAGIDTASSNGVFIAGVTCAANTGAAITSPANVSLIKIWGLVSSGHANTYANGSSCNGTVYLKDVTSTDTTFNGMNGAGFIGMTLIADNVNATNSTTYSLLGTISTSTSVTQPGSGTSWKFAVTSALAASAATPVSKSIGRFACKGGTARTITYYAARTNSNLSGQLRVTGGVNAGVGSAGTDVVTALTPTANASPGPSDFSQFSISFTPTSDCVVEVWADWWTANGTTTYSGYIDGPITAV